MSKDDTYYEEEACSIAFAEKAYALYMSYVTSALAFVQNEKADEGIMRSLEEACEIPEQAAIDFRISVVVSYCGLIHKDQHRYGWRSYWEKHSVLASGIKKCINEYNELCSLYQKETLNIGNESLLKELFFKYVRHAAALIDQKDLVTITADNQKVFEKPDIDFIKAIELYVPNLDKWPFRTSVVNHGTAMIFYANDQYRPWEMDGFLKKGLMTYIESNNETKIIPCIGACTCPIQTLMASGCQCGKKN